MELPQLARAEFGTLMPTTPNTDRARGALWGQAVGDALGTTQEFSRPRDRRPFPALNDGPQTTIEGGGPYGLKPGEVTDDTQMAACLASSLAARGAFDADDVAARYVAWTARAFDIGNQTRMALALVRKGRTPAEAGRETWEIGHQRQAGNGSLMRCSPLPVFFAQDPAALRAAALADSAITHFDPRCRLACAAFCASIRYALVTEGPEAGGILAAARAELAAAAELVRQDTPPELVDQAVSELQNDLEAATQPDPGLDEPPLHITSKSMGFVRIAFRLAYWELQHAPTFEVAVLDVANRGGDADTNAAIAGALYGALVGEAGIPAAWRETIESAARPDDPHSALRLFDALR